MIARNLHREGKDGRTRGTHKDVQISRRVCVHIEDMYALGHQIATDCERTREIINIDSAFCDIIILAWRRLEEQIIGPDVSPAKRSKLENSILRIFPRN